MGGILNKEGASIGNYSGGLKGYLGPQGGMGTTRQTIAPQQEDAFRAYLNGVIQRNQQAPGMFSGATQPLQKVGNVYNTNEAPRAGTYWQMQRAYQDKINQDAAIEAANRAAAMATPAPARKSAFDMVGEYATGNGNNWG